MGLLSPLATASDETSPDIVEQSPIGEVKTTEGDEQKPSEQAGSSILSPSAVSQSSEEETAAARDGDRNNENTWTGDLWSHEDVRSFPLYQMRMFLDLWMIHSFLTSK